MSTGVAQHQGAAGDGGGDDLPAHQSRQANKRISEVGISSFDLRDEIHIKLAQAKGICWVIHGGGDLAVIGDRSIKDSLWAVDELLEDAKKAVDELYQQTTEGSQPEMPRWCPLHAEEGTASSP